MIEKTDFLNVRTLGGTDAPVWGGQHHGSWRIQAFRWRRR